jgi:hypothetical protein
MNFNFFLFINLIFYLMKKVSVVLLVVAMAISLSLVSCGGGGGSTPADLEKNLWTYVQKGDYEKAIKYWADISVDGDTKDQMKTMTSMFAEKMKSTMEEKDGLKEFKIVKETISDDGETATVDVSFTYGNGSTEEQSNKYTKVDGKWKKDNSMK